ncbi:MAG: cobalt-precorrin-6A reductase [Paracoccaceae bacterium]
MRLLLLAGTGEARQIARGLASELRVSAMASLAGATRMPTPLGIPTRIGGFGGRDGLRAWLRASRTDAVLDATHPFASTISHNAVAVCAELGLPYLMFLRPAWTPDPGDDWVFLNAEEEAASRIPQGKTVLLTTGHGGLERFGPMPGRRVVVRVVEPVTGPLPFERGEVVLARPPHTVDDELALFERHGVDWVVAKNSGGPSRARLDAARAMGLPVAMLRRPLQPEAPRVTTVAAALGWVRGLL